VKYIVYAIVAFMILIIAIQAPETFTALFESCEMVQDGLEETTN